MKIVDHRRQRVRQEGYALAAELAIPETRKSPLTPPPKDPFVICEVKRASPSRGTIAEIPDPVSQTARYRQGGARAVSVLTEEDFFSGSLDDLMRIKQRFPDLTVLRKDFLFSREDIDLSWRAGADMVLLIASILTKAELQDLYAYAVHYGLTPLVEIHDQHDIDAAEKAAPEFAGFNSRDLRTFTIDRLLPLELIDGITWKSRKVYESGIRGMEDARFAGAAGFDAVLVGETAVRSPELIPEILDGLKKGVQIFRSFFSESAETMQTMHGTQHRTQHRTQHSKERTCFWNGIARRKSVTSGKSSAKSDRPLVKICGITNREDAEAAAEFGADILGFILAESPRKTDPEFIRSLKDLDVLKAAVVVLGPYRPDADYSGAGGIGGMKTRLIVEEVQKLLADGVLDAVQFHGDETPEDCRLYSEELYPFYKAVQVRSPEDVDRIETYRSPRILIDAGDPSAPYLRGGTGKRVEGSLLMEYRRRYPDMPLWLAGGIRPENVEEILMQWRPELIDVSSGVEAYPGKKDRERMRQLFEKIETASEKAYSTK